MEFYISLYQITAALEQLNRGFQHLAGRAFRISPRSAQATHELFNRCGQEAQTLEKLLNKGDYNKITLKRTALLFQALEATHRRLVLLSGAAEPGSPEDIPADAVGTSWAWPGAISASCGKSCPRGRAPRWP